MTYAVSRQEITWLALHHHEQQLARHAPDDASFEADLADRVEIEGDLVVLRRGNRVVGRYRFNRRPIEREDSANPAIVTEFRPA